MTKEGQGLECIGRFDMDLSCGEKQAIVETVGKEVKERSIRFDGFGPVSHRFSVLSFHQQALLLRKLSGEFDCLSSFRKSLDFIA